MAYFQPTSPLFRTGVKSIHQGNHYLRKGQVSQAFSVYKRSLSEMMRVRRNWPHNHWPEKCFLVNHQYRFVYCPVPKVACSSIKECVLKLTDVERHGKVLETHGMIHRYMQQHFSLATCEQNQARDILRKERYFKFIFVRHPWSRLVSAYLDKFVHHLNLEDEVFVKRVIDTVYQRQQLTPDYEKGITFRQFLNYINTTPDDDLNSHWKPQYLFLGNVKFDFIGKFETLAQDFDYLSDRLNVKIDLPWSHKAQYRSTVEQTQDYSNHYAIELRQMSYSPTYQYFFPPDLKTLFQARYQRDISQFNYSFDRPK